MSRKTNWFRCCLTKPSVYRSWRMSARHWRRKQKRLTGVGPVEGVTRIGGLTTFGTITLGVTISVVITLGATATDSLGTGPKARSQEGTIHKLFAKKAKDCTRPKRIKAKSWSVMLTIASAKKHGHVRTVAFIRDESPTQTGRRLRPHKQPGLQCTARYGGRC